MRTSTSKRLVTVNLAKNLRRSVPVTPHQRVTVTTPFHGHSRPLPARSVRAPPSANPNTRLSVGLGTQAANQGPVAQVHWTRETVLRIRQRRLVADLNFGSAFFNSLRATKKRRSTSTVNFGNCFGKGADPVPMKTEPTEQAAGSEFVTNHHLRPEASALRLTENLIFISLGWRSHGRHMV